MSAVPTRMRLNKEISAELRARAERVLAAAAGAGGQNEHATKAWDMAEGILDTENWELASGALRYSRTANRETFATAASTSNVIFLARRTRRACGLQKGGSCTPVA